MTLMTFFGTQEKLYDNFLLATLVLFVVLLQLEKSSVT